jgi:DNA-binding XRE family transcriptional regulator
MQKVGYLGVLFQLMRQRRGMTLAELSALLEAHKSGVSAATYSEMEAGRYLPDDGGQFLRVYTSVLDLTQDELHMVVNLWSFAILTEQMGEDLARASMRD